jgi:hypothetical protein
MTNQDAFSRFFKICAGVSLVLFSTGFLFFSLKCNPAIAGANAPQGPNAYDYKPIGIEATKDRVIVYGFDPKAVDGYKIAVLANEHPTGR